MELTNKTCGRDGQNYTAQNETYHNPSNIPSEPAVSEANASCYTPIQTQDIYHSPARSLYLDIQAMTHYSLAQIAQLCDIPLSTFYRLAMGTTRNPLYKTFDKLLRTYFIVLLKHSQPSTELN